MKRENKVSNENSLNNCNFDKDIKLIKNKFTNVKQEL